MPFEGLFLEKSAELMIQIHHINRGSVCEIPC